MDLRSIIGILLGFGTALVVGAAPARAAEAYLCGASTIVYVEASDLERMKQTNPCIAAYYGLKVDAASDTARAESQGLAPAKTSTGDTASLLRPLADAEIKHSTREPVVRQAAAVVAAPETDYRNVRILNPTTPDDAWYRHAK